MCNHCTHSLLIDGVEHIEEVSTIWLLAFGEIGGKIDGDVGIVLEFGIEIGDGNFVVFGRVDPLDLRHLEQLLLASEDIAEEILVGAAIWRDIEPNSNDISDDEGLTEETP